MRFRKLRIAWSAQCGIVYVLLLMLWVRTYWHPDFIPKRLVSKPAWQVRSYGGSIDLIRWNTPSNVTWTRTPSIKVTIPHTALALTIAFAAIAPWVNWSKRFSLRTLLIATTVMAAVLGFTLYWPRK